jgi:predicted amidohydrolase
MLFLPEGLGFLGNNSQETIQNAESAESLEAGLSTESFIDVEPWCKSLCHAIHTHASTIEGNPPIVYSSSDDAKDIHNENVSIIRGLQTIARESGLWISGGGVHILGAPTTIDSLDDENKTPRVYNTHLILNNYGQVVASYRKIHLFEVSIPTQNLRFRESSYTAAGDQLVLCSSPIGTLGLSTCFDVRFPEMYTALRNAGADILLVPSAFTVPTGQAHWHTLLRGM